MKTSILFFAAVFSISAFYSCTKDNSGKNQDPASTTNIEEVAPMARTSSLTNPIVPEGKYHLLNVGTAKYYQHNGRPNNPEFSMGVVNDSPDPGLSSYEVVLVDDSTGYIYSLVNSPSGQLIKSAMQPASSFPSYRDLGFIANTTPLQVRFRTIAGGIRVLYAGNVSFYNGHTMHLITSSTGAQVKLLKLVDDEADVRNRRAIWKFVPAS